MRVFGKDEIFVSAGKKMKGRNTYTTKIPLKITREKSIRIRLAWTFKGAGNYAVGSGAVIKMEGDSVFILIGIPIPIERR